MDECAGSSSGRNAEELPRAAADVGGERAVDDHHERSGRPRRTAAAPSPRVDCCSGPVQDRAVGIGRVGRGQQDDFRFVGQFLERSQQVEGRRQRELRGADAAGKVAAPNPPGILERLEDVVDRAEAAGDAFGRRDLAGQDAVARQQLLREGGGRAPSRDTVAPARAAISDQRPSAVGGAIRRLRKVRGGRPAVALAPHPGGGSLRPRRSGGRVNARTAFKLSLVMAPAHTSVQIAVDCLAG